MHIGSDLVRQLCGRKGTKRHLAGEEGGAVLLERVAHGAEVHAGAHVPQRACAAKVLTLTINSMIFLEQIPRIQPYNKRPPILHLFHQPSTRKPM